MSGIPPTQSLIIPSPDEAPAPAGYRLERCVYVLSPPTSTPLASGSAIFTTHPANERLISAPSNTPTRYFPSPSPTSTPQRLCLSRTHSTSIGIDFDDFLNQQAPLLGSPVTSPLLILIISSLFKKRYPLQRLSRRTRKKTTSFFSYCFDTPRSNRPVSTSLDTNGCRKTSPPLPPPSISRQDITALASTPIGPSDYFICHPQPTAIPWFAFRHLLPATSPRNLSCLPNINNFIFLLAIIGPSLLDTRLLAVGTRQN